MKSKKQLSAAEKESLLKVLKARFQKNMNRHKDISWNEVQKQLEQQPDKLWTLNEMEKSGGEPDVVSLDKKTDGYLFIDCAAESPKGRRSLCYDRQALDERKEHKPKNSALDLASEMGVELLSEETYRKLQQVGPFDQKTSSWIKTPADIREKGGAIFADYRYGHVFIYHNGAQSYYGSRGFRGSIKI